MFAGILTGIIAHFHSKTWIDTKWPGIRGKNIIALFRLPLINSEYRIIRARYPTQSKAFLAKPAHSLNLC